MVDLLISFGDASLVLTTQQMLHNDDRKNREYNKHRYLFGKFVANEFILFS